MGERQAPFELAHGAVEVGQSVVHYVVVRDAAVVRRQFDGASRERRRHVANSPIGPSAKKGGVMTPDDKTRAAIEGHWQASESGDSKVEHAIYSADAILDYPQSGERFRGHGTISPNAALTLPSGPSPFSGSSAAGTSG